MASTGCGVRWDGASSPPLQVGPSSQPRPIRAQTSPPSLLSRRTGQGRYPILPYIVRDKPVIPRRPAPQVG